MPAFTPRSLPSLQPSSVDERIRKACQYPKINAVRRYLPRGVSAGIPKITYWSNSCDSLVGWTTSGHGWSISTADKVEGTGSLQSYCQDAAGYAQHGVSPSPSLPSIYWYKFWIHVFAWPGTTGRYSQHYMRSNGILWGVRLHDMAGAGMQWRVWIAGGETSAPSESKIHTWMRVKIRVEDNVGLSLYVNDVFKVSRGYPSPFPAPINTDIWASWFMGWRTDYISLEGQQAD